MLLALATFATFATMAATAAPGTEAPAARNSSSLERSLDRQLNKHLTFPINSTDDELMGAVEVSFVINREGKVEVLSAHSDNGALRAYVLSKLRKVDIGENPMGTWRTSHVRFVFRPEA